VYQRIEKKETHDSHILILCVK